MTGFCLRRTRVWGHVLLLCALPAFGVIGQRRVTLQVDHVLLPTTQVDVGYLVPPILPYRVSGVVAADGMDKRIVVLPGAGATQRLIGGPGEGPGEFRNIPTMVVRGDSLVLTDQSLRRVTVINGQTGRVGDTWPVGLDARWRNRIVRPIVAFSKECWLGAVSHVVRRPVSLDEPVETRTIFLLVHERGGETRYDSVTEHHNTGTHIRPLGEMVANRVPSPVGVIPRLAVSPSGNGFAIIEAAPAPTSGIVVHHGTSPCQEKPTRLAIPVEPRELTIGQVRDEYRRRLSRRTGAAPRLEAMIDDALTQTVKVNGKYRAPPFTAAMLDDRGVLWIEVEGVYDLRDYGRPRLWWQVDRSGRRLLDVVVPSDIRLQSATATRALGWRTSEQGGEAVELRMPQ